MTSLIADLLERLDDERRYEFEERAGIIEVENGQPRDLAECLALIDLLRSYPGALVGVTAFEVERNGFREFVLSTAPDALDNTTGHVLRVVDLVGVVRDRFGGIAALTCWRL